MKTFAFTGTMPTLTRAAARMMIENAGGIVFGAGFHVDYLVAGTEPGSLLDWARARGVPVIDEAGLVSMLQAGGAP